MSNFEHIEIDCTDCPVSPYTRLLEAHGIVFKVVSLE